MINPLIRDLLEEFFSRLGNRTADDIISKSDEYLRELDKELHRIQEISTSYPSIEDREFAIDILEVIGIDDISGDQIRSMIGKVDAISIALEDQRESLHLLDNLAIEAEAQAAQVTEVVSIIDQILETNEGYKIDAAAGYPLTEARLRLSEELRPRLDKIRRAAAEKASDFRKNIEAIERKLPIVREYIEVYKKISRNRDRVSALRRGARLAEGNGGAVAGSEFTATIVQLGETMAAETQAARSKAAEAAQKQSAANARARGVARFLSVLGLALKGAGLAASVVDEGVGSRISPGGTVDTAVSVDITEPMVIDVPISDNQREILNIGNDGQNRFIRIENKPTAVPGPR